VTSLGGGGSYGAIGGAPGWPNSRMTGFRAKSVAIVGAGLAGLPAADQLSRDGHEVTVLAAAI